MAPRRRASTLKTSVRGHEDLKVQLEQLKSPTDERVVGVPHRTVQAAHLVRQIIATTDAALHPKDAFRHLGGFQTILNALEDVTCRIGKLSATSPTLPSAIELLQTLFSVLTLVFHNHEGNRRYFHERAHNGGWGYIHRLLSQLFLALDRENVQLSRRLSNAVFGSLLACALDDESAPSLFQSLPPQPLDAGSVNGAPIERNPHPTQDNTDQGQDSLHDDSICRHLGLSSRISIGQPLFIMLDLWMMLKKERLVESTQQIALRLPLWLARSSTHNLCKLHGTGMLGLILSELRRFEGEDERLNAQLMLSAKELLTLGFSRLEDALTLYRSASSSNVLGRLLLHALESSETPAFVHFDLSLQGYAAIELPSLPKSFPPPSNVTGYTVSIWFKIVRFDPAAHTTLFGAFDATQACFVLVYIEKDTHNLILQTSIRSSTPSVRFKSARFEQGMWYHIAITHRRPKTTSSSKASLFVNGEFVEQIKSQYPSLPPKCPSSVNGDHHADSIEGRNRVQTFLGTPQDLASRVGKDSPKTQWRLSSAQLFADVLSDDLIAVYFRLGPRYNGNYQDCLGSFQTYEASAQLNIRNESLYPGKEDRSELVTAVRSKAGQLLPEDRILLNISALNIFSREESSGESDLLPLQVLSKASYRQFLQISQAGHGSVALNGSLVSFEQSLRTLPGHAFLTGIPDIVAKTAIDSAAWQLGGCTPVCLVSIDSAGDAEAFLTHMQIFFAVIRNDWRNSEAVERDNGFGILANILSSRLKKFDSKFANTVESNTAGSGTIAERPSMRCLKLILKFIGYRPGEVEESIINNPLAYRILLVDLEIWRQLSLDVQTLYYQQFFDFVESSKYQAFNSKRLSRMRIVKKWIEALRHQHFTNETFQPFLRAFTLLARRNFTADVMRSLACYITYALYEPEHRMNDHATKNGGISGYSTPNRRRKTISTPSPGDATPTDTDRTDLRLHRLQVASGVLKAYADMLCFEGETASIGRFARTVTNKWLLYLLAEPDLSVMESALRILARLLVNSGAHYVKKFVSATGGVKILRQRLQRCWNVPTTWYLCFAILFGKDPATLSSQDFELFNLVQTFSLGTKQQVLCVDILPVITCMLKTGLASIARERNTLDAPSPSLQPPKHLEPGPKQMTHARQRSLTADSSSITASAASKEIDATEGSRLLHTVIRFLADIHSTCAAFRDLAVNSSYVQDLFSTIYPLIVGSSAVSAETELHTRDSALTFKGEDVAMKPMGTNSSKGASIIRTLAARQTGHQSAAKPQPPRRMSSYVLVKADLSDREPKLQTTIPTSGLRPSLAITHTLVQDTLELVLGVFCDQIFSRKDFPGLGLFMRVPPGFQEHQAYFETFVLRNAMSHIENTIKLDRKLLWEPRVLTNLARLASHLREAIFEGWFIEGADDTFNFLAGILEYMQLPDVSSIKSVRLCSATIESIRSMMHRVVLSRLSEIDDDESESLVECLNRLSYWQTVLLAGPEASTEFLRLLIYLVYNCLHSPHVAVQTSAVNLLRLTFVHRYDSVSSILLYNGDKTGTSVLENLHRIVELDDDTFLKLVGKHKQGIEDLFQPLAKIWASFVEDENQRTEDNARARVNKRREKLKTLAAEDLDAEDFLRRHDAGREIWRSNIYNSEHLKRQRALQDQQDMREFNISAMLNMRQALYTCNVHYAGNSAKQWRLDETEGHNRMRLRFIREAPGLDDEFRPKRRQSGLSAGQNASVSDVPKLDRVVSRAKSQQLTLRNNSQKLQADSPNIEISKDDEGSNPSDEEFEIVDDPRGDLEAYEDKNRKVMQSIQRGDQVEDVHNTARIVGLEAIESLLIIGKSHLYLLDNLFQRLDGEIVNVVQAPEDERDHYLRMISGQKSSTVEPHLSKTTFESRNWQWDEVLSLSKRRFLFRDVAIEVFFVNGQSYLLISRDPPARDELYQKLQNRARNSPGRNVILSEEDSLRIEALRSVDDNVQSLSTRLTNVFTQHAPHPITRRWMRGEISNFYYLMVVNTLAGRTFNDLTQYPVFPWVIADYTSEELDLTNPKTFRDLSKPMGCQHVERQADFKERYQSFKDMADENAPPFHYGTHYSSAMIVTSYLIRLQPFVKSYLLLQGGFFDHADRLFYSIEKAWHSASRDNMTDVRELIPEFFCLPEFLSNINGYDLGERQANGEKIDSVALPPWAKNDPKIFIAKHREALESDYVSRKLHAWIDLVFGYKQKGEAAIEATNVFHHLSYHGAKDLDAITDPVERLATIGIIHNFGQTPHQVFYRPHPPKESSTHGSKRLDMAAESLTRLPFPVLETQKKVSALEWSQKLEKLLPCGPQSLVVDPTLNRHLEWGFGDGGIRFVARDSKKILGLFERIHVTHLSTILFVGPKTLVTAGTDCTISLWNVLVSAKAVDLQPKKSLFGHSSPVTLLTASRSFSTLLSASMNGEVMLWDLNRMEFIRVLTKGERVECARINDVNGNIVLCRDSKLSIWNLNGDALIEQDIYVEGDDSVSSCAFYEGNGVEYLERQLVFTGHARGVVNVWSIAIRRNCFVFDHVKRMHHMDHAGFNIGAAITAILPMSQVVYTGDEEGRVYEWDCIQRQ